MSNRGVDERERILVYLLNKKEDIDAEKSRSGTDLFELEVQSLINSIESSKSAIYSRRSEIIGIGIILAEGKFIGLFDEAVRAYNLGMFYSTIALCGMTAERICYDYIDLCQITLRDQDFNATSKEELYHTPFSRLVEFFSKSGIFDERTRTVLLQINNTRNSHVHPKMSSDEKKDALGMLNQLCEVIENLLSVFRNRNISEGN